MVSRAWVENRIFNEIRYRRLRTSELALQLWTEMTDTVLLRKRPSHRFFSQSRNSRVTKTKLKQLSVWMFAQSHGQIIRYCMMTKKSRVVFPGSSRFVHYRLKWSGPKTICPMTNFEITRQGPLIRREYQQNTPRHSSEVVQTAWAQTLLV